SLAFMCYRLAHVVLPPMTPQNQVLIRVGQQWAALLNGKPIMAGQTVAYSSSQVSIPSGATQFVKADDQGSVFRADITLSGTEVNVRVTGRFGTSTGSAW